LKYAQFRRDAVGESWEVFYLRDKESREVDFVVTFNRRVHWLIEVKASDDNPGTSLRLLHREIAASRIPAARTQSGSRSGKIGNQDLAVGPMARRIAIPDERRVRFGTGLKYTRMNENILHNQ
jgi:hypothetical protein